MKNLDLPFVFKQMRTGGYYLRDAEKQAIAALTQPRLEGARAMLVQGLQGVGKSSLAASLAQALDADLVVEQFHSWTSPEELYQSINIHGLADKVAGNEEAETRRPGFLARVAAASHKGLVVALGDEFDKTPERVENLFLDVLQSGRVPDGEGGHLLINMDNVVWVFTSNRMRRFSRVFLRRVRRVHMEPLPVKLVEELMMRSTGASHDLCRAIRKISGEVVQQIDGRSDTYASPQELTNLVNEILHGRKVGVITNRNGMTRALLGWIAEDVETGFAKIEGSEHLQNRINALWGLVKRETK